MDDVAQAYLIDRMIAEGKEFYVDTERHVIVPAAYAKEVCIARGGRDQCRFLGDDGKQKMCHKVIDKDRDQIEREVHDYLEQCDEPGMVPLGDNCNGYGVDMLTDLRVCVSQAKQIVDHAKQLERKADRVLDEIVQLLER